MAEAPEKRKEPPFHNCPCCGIPQIDDKHALVLYFASADDCREAVAAFKEALPQSFRAYAMEGEIDG